MKKGISIGSVISAPGASPRRTVRKRDFGRRRSGKGSSAGEARRSLTLAVPTLWSSLNDLYREHLGFRSVTTGRVGEKTKADRRLVLERAVRDLVHSGYKLRRIGNLKEKHVRRILDLWRLRGLAESTLATYVSHLRTLCNWLHNSGLIGAVDRYVEANPSMTRRHLVTNQDRSERAAGVTKEEILRLAMQLDERFACQLRLIMAFGLRSQEAWMLRPHLAEGQGGTVVVRWGTKNGRPRVLPPMTAEQRDALAFAKRFAASASESTMPRGWKLERWRNRYYWLLRKLGMTRAQLGLTPHSLRHGILMDHYESLTGVPAPVRGGELRRRDPFADRAARDDVAGIAGHRRRSISSVYIGCAALSGDSSTFSSSEVYPPYKLDRKVPAPPGSLPS
jgi:integrase